ncbi:MAG: hypothetical protein LUC51_08875, partial [Cloacibacillus porcorum]|nr:hypothetical protein [Cloacibacillus porcorum]
LRFFQAFLSTCSNWIVIKDKALFIPCTVEAKPLFIVSPIKAKSLFFFFPTCRKPLFIVSDHY